MILPVYIEILLYTLLFLSLVIVSYGFYLYIYLPSYKLYMDLQSPPPMVGDKKEIIISNKERKKSYRIGLLDSDFPLRLKGVEDPHLEIVFHKEKDLEEYEIIFLPHVKNKILWKAPHTSTYQFLNETEIIESREMIGHPAYIRIVALIQNQRPIHYVEFEFSVKYFFELGEEKMKFILKIVKIYPGVDLQSRDKKGIYSFGRMKTDDQDAA